MSSGETLKGVVRHLRATLGNAPTDLELLTRYAQRRDEAAFADLVRRHGGLVLGVARRQLSDVHQADDVFQATFLALARSAPRLGRPVSLASWLYTVALRQARKARLGGARRASRERAVAARPAPPADPLAEISGRELVALIDEELARLPDAYRLPLLLCCVQGLSREEAGRQLGWPDGVVKGRLERGRRRLAARLARRGVAPAALVLVPVAAVAVPDSLLAAAAALAAAPWSRSIPAAVSGLAAAEAPRRVLAAVGLLGSLLAAGLVGLVGLALAAAQRVPSKDDSLPPPAAEAAPDRTDDPLPAGSTLRFGTARFRHGTAIESLAVSADDRLAVAASGNHWLGSTRAFDLASSRALYTLEHTGPFVEAVALSPDGRTLAARQDNAVRLCDAATGREVRKVTLPPANPRTITQWIAFAPDGKALAAASEGKVIHLVDLETGTVTRSFKHDNVVFTVAFSADGLLLAAGGYDSEGANYFGRIWEVGTGKELRRFSNGRGGLRTLAFSPDGTLLAGGGDDARLRLWDVATGQERRAFPPDGYRLRSVAFAPDGRTVAAAGDSVHLYDPATGKERQHIERKALGLHFSADGRTLTGAVAGAVYRWDTATGRPLTPDTGGDSVVDQVVVTPDGRRVITRDEASQAHVWDAATGKHLRRLGVSYTHGVALSPDGRFLAWSLDDPAVKFPDPERPTWIYDGGRTHLYDLAADRLVDRFPSYKGDAQDLAFTPDGRTLVGVDHRDGTVRLWDVAAGKEQRSFRALRDDEKKGSYRVWHAAVSPDGRTLAVAYQPAFTTGFFQAVVVRLWDVAEGKELHELTGHSHQVLDLAFSPDSRLLVTCSENAYGPARAGQRSPVDRVFVWDVATGKPAAGVPPDGLPLGAGSAAFSADGRALATASADGVIRLWETATWTVRAEFRGHRDRVSALAFGPDGRLFSGSLDTTVLAWDVRPPRPEGDRALAAAWDDLTHGDAAQAFRAQGRLRAAPAEAVALFAARLEPARPIDPKRVAELIADLDSPQFATRDRAAAGLRQLGRPAAAALREAKEKSASAEVRRRASNLLAELEESPTAPEELRALRSVEVLEWLGTPEARRLLAQWATGERGAVLTQAAAAALGRLNPAPGEGK
jgi:RNA polymerase sigma factor (sigma-70 family)